MNNFFHNLYSRLYGYFRRYMFHLTDRQFQNLKPGFYQTKYSIFYFKKKHTNSIADKELRKLSKGLDCLKIAAEICYESSGLQDNTSLLDWLNQADINRGYINNTGWLHSELVGLAKKFNLASYKQECLSIYQLCTKILNNKLILASVNPNFEVRHGDKPKKGGHFVIVYGFEKQQQKCAGFYVFDPSYQKSEQFVPIETFKNAFSGRVILISIDDKKIEMMPRLQKKNSWIEIDLGAIRHNVQQVRTRVGDDVSIIGVVKSDAYGHGIVHVAKTLLNSGVNMLSVAYIAEAKKLRDNGISAPVLLLYGLPVWNIKQALMMDLDITVYDIESVKILSAIAREQKKIANIHIKIDTGMGWFGLSGDHLNDFFSVISKLPNIEIKGIFSHLSNADADDPKYTNMQIDRFKEILGKYPVPANNILYNIANSAAIVKYPAAYFNAVRPGIMLYGYLPMKNHDEHIKLRPALSFRTRIIQTRELAPEESIGYGNTYQTDKNMLIGILPVGYFDGIPRQLSNKGRVLVHEHYAEIKGNICMNMCMIDITGIPEVRVGDEVVIIGRQGSLEIGADYIADQVGTISYDILVHINKHIPKIFINSQF